MERVSPSMGLISWMIVACRYVITSNLLVCGQLLTAVSSPLGKTNAIVRKENCTAQKGQVVWLCILTCLLSHPTVTVWCFVCSNWHFSSASSLLESLLMCTLHTCWGKSSILLYAHFHMCVLLAWMTWQNCNVLISKRPMTSIISGYGARSLSVVFQK